MITLESRLAAVERQLRFHWLVIAGLLVALVALVGYGATEGVPEEIRARRLVLLNKNGVPVISAGASFDEYGYVNVNDREGRILVSVGVGGNLGGKLTVLGSNLRHGVEVEGFGADGGGLVQVFNKTGEVVVQAHADEYGMGYVGAFDRQGKGRTLTPR